MPVDALARNLAEAPWRLSSREQTILESALESLAGAKANVGHVYYDCTPANLLFENGQLFPWLIRPMCCGKVCCFGIFRASAARCDAIYGDSACGDRPIDGVR